MEKMTIKEIKDIAMWEENDSELAKYSIQQALNRVRDLKKQIKELFDEYLELKDRIDRAIEYINDNGILDLNGYDLLDILRGETNE